MAKPKKDTDQMTGEEYLKYMASQKEKKPSKYGNKWVKHAGINFQSVAERDRYIVLVYMKEHGEIKDFKRQHLFKFIVNGILITTWRCDFIVHTNDGSARIEDVKGFITGEYLIKKALLKACYGLDVYEPNLDEPATKKTRKF